MSDTPLSQGALQKENANKNENKNKKNQESQKARENLFGFRLRPPIDLMMTNGSVLGSADQAYSYSRVFLAR